MLGLLVAAAGAYVLLAPPPGPSRQPEKHVRLTVPPPEAAKPAPAPEQETAARKMPEQGAPEEGKPEREAAASAPPEAPDDEPQTARSAAGEEARAPADDGAAPEPPPPPPDKTTEPEGVTVVGAADTGGESDAATAASPPKPAWKRYARGLSPPPGVARVAIVVRGLGLSSAATEAAIERLPGAVSLSFTPYARRAAEWSARARANGHEVLVDMPMEPRDFPARDPGPQALMVEVPEHGNLDRLDWMLSKGREVVGVVAQMGSRFLDSPQAIEPVLRELRARGLMYVDNGVVPGAAALRIAERIDLPHAVNDRTLDDGQVSRPAIEARLVEVERIAQQEGLAVALAHPYPVTIDLLATWSEDLQKRGFALVPVTDAVQRRRPARAER